MITITLDTNCINNNANSALDQIFELKIKGNIEIFVTDRVFYEILTGKEDINVLPKSQQIPALKRLLKAKKLGEIKSGFRFLSHLNKFPMLFSDEELKKSISDIMFPNSTIDERDVDHLYAHIKANNDYFITKNSAHYINGGRKEKLKNNFGITVLEPEELLDLL